MGLEDELFELCYDAQSRGRSPDEIISTLEIVLMTLNDEWIMMFENDGED